MFNYENEKIWIEQEFRNLLKAYPIDHLLVDDLHIFPSEGKESSEASIMQHTDKEENWFSVVMVLGGESLENWDVEFLNKLGVDENHIHAWMLYHEYGHLLDMNELVIKIGQQELQERLLENQERVEDLLEKAELEKFREEDIQTLYRQLPFEIAADQWAKKIYDQRKNQIKY